MNVNIAVRATIYEAVPAADVQPTPYGLQLRRNSGALATCSLPRAPPPLRRACTTSCAAPQQDCGPCCVYPPLSSNHTMSSVMAVSPVYCQTRPNNVVGLRPPDRCGTRSRNHMAAMARSEWPMPPAAPWPHQSKGTHQPATLLALPFWKSRKGAADAGSSFIKDQFSPTCYWPMKSTERHRKHNRRYWKRCRNVALL